MRAMSIGLDWGDETLIERLEAVEIGNSFVSEPLGVSCIGPLAAAARELGGELVAAGVEPGDRILLDGLCGLAWAHAFFAILMARAVAVPVARVARANELAYIAADAGATLALVTHEGDHAFGDGVRVVRAPIRVAEGRPRALPLPEPTSAAMILYTSGTTGAPKGAVLFCIARSLHRPASSRKRGGSGRATSFFTRFRCITSTASSSRFSRRLFAGGKRDGAAQVSARGGPRAHAEGNRLDGRADDVRTHDRGNGRGARVEARRMVQGDLRALRLLTSGSAALPASLATRIRNFAGVLPLERYGMTEIGMALSNPLDPKGRREGRVGTPLPSVELRIVDDTGTDTDGPGELWVRGPSLFSGYHGREEETRASFVGDWFKTGDIGERDATGSIRLLGRSSVDILKTGGEKVSAVEIEETLRELAGLSDVAVVGIPDPTWGDRVVAFVVARDAVLDDAAVRAFCRERLAPFKVPKEVRFVDALPRNAMGKVQKRVLAGS